MTTIPGPVSITDLAADWAAHDRQGRSPLDRHTESEWVQMFTRCGFFRHHETFVYGPEGSRTAERTVTTSYEPAPASVTVYRCASPGRERGMAWTDSADYARHYGTPTFGYHPIKPQIFSVTVPREAVLAILTSSTRAGGRVAEYVLNPRYLHTTKEN